jgi:hypothetical protein
MANNSITFRDFLLNMTTMTGRRSNSQMVVDARIRYKIDSVTHQRIEGEPDGYTVDIIAAHGRTQSVKLPKETKLVVEKIMDAIRDQKVVKVNFGEPSTLRGRCYALINGSGQLIQGVSATATEINILSVEDDEYDCFDDEVIM